MTRNITSRISPIGLALLVAVMAGAVYTWLSVSGQTSSEMTQQETAPPPPGRELATFSAGCFWSMQAIFQQLRGVDKVDPGYSGGTAPHPSYGFVETGTTGYAESVNITFDPKVISYRELVKILLTARDPTTLDSQGPDVGSQYRSVIWCRDRSQQLAAQDVIDEITKSQFWSQPIVTTVEPFKTFYRAEDYHLNYYSLHPDQPYCRQVIAPEIARFRGMYKAELKQ
jgi:peptide-methionine (S)-S-oxide reductase